MEYHNKEIDVVLKDLNSTRDGLSSKEVNNRLKKYGLNIISIYKKENIILKFLKEFNDLMIIILLISAFISFIMSYLNNESYIDSIIIILIVLINSILGFIQELKADKSIEKLRKMQKSRVKVRRNNKLMIIDGTKIVPGDIIILEAGDRVLADARIINTVSLKLDESSLTGESVPVLKNNDVLEEEISLMEKSNMVYSGTNVVYGKGEAIVIATGINTEFGKIAKSLETNEKEITPLQRRINNISKVLSLIIFIIIFLMLLVGLYRGIEIGELLMLSISLAVAAIPEGLPAVITIVLSLGMNSLAKNKAVVRKMSSVETLGCTEIICSDKTGTITQNKMTVQEIVFNNQVLKENKDYNSLIEIMALNNDVEEDNSSLIGEPTEIALYEYARKYIDINELRNNHPRLSEIPFDSERKLMTTVHKFGDKYRVLTKGSFDSIITRCKKQVIDDQEKRLTNNLKEIISNLEKNESNKTYRILAFAYKEIDDLENLDEDNLILTGLVAMIDPPRNDVEDAIKLCKMANIKPIMITGDSKDTAIAIAKEIGIINDDNEAISGIEFDNLSLLEKQNLISKYKVFARVSPANKLEIVTLLQDQNKIVAMTGDGVNDAPALKKANIGVGMGIMGTEVSKNVSDIILVDDSFKTIVVAVKEGRRIYDNIRNVLTYLLTGNISEVLVVFICMLFGYEIFLPIQLLYINLITDSIPAIALAFEKEDPDIMKRPIRKNNSTFFTRFLISKISISAILKTINILFVFFLMKSIYGVQVAATMAFLTLALLEMIFAYTCRNLKRNMLTNNLFANKQLNKSILILTVLQIIVFVTPFRNIFSLVELNIIQISYCIIIVIIEFIIDEITKTLFTKKFKD